MEDKEVKVNIRFNIVKLLYYGAMAAVAIGFLYAILSAVGLGGFASGSAKAGQFFQALLSTLFVSGSLAFLSEFLSSRKKQD